MFLSRKPLAPAASASNTYSSSSKVVSTSTRTPASSSSATMRRVASSPSITGMRMSIRTTSGRVERASSTAAAPSPASPDHLDVPGVVQQRPEPGPDQPLVVRQQDPDQGSRAGHREAGLDAEAAPGAGAGLEAAAQRPGPFPHARDALARPANLPVGVS